MVAIPHLPVAGLSIRLNTSHNPAMPQQPLTVNRTLVGVISVVLLATAAIFSLMDIQEMWAGACLKVGLVMGAFWLALPSLTRNPELGQVSLVTLLGALAVALIIGRTKIPLKIVLPTLAAFVFAIRILGPRRTPASPPRHPRRDF